MRAEGWTLRAIADVFAVSSATILDRLGAGSIPATGVVAVNGKRYRQRPARDPRPCRWCDEPNRRHVPTCSTDCERERRRFVEYTAGGLPSVRGWPPRPHPDPARLERVRQLRATGLPLSEIAIEVGVSPATVHRDLHGLRRRLPTYPEPR